MDVFRFNNPNSPTKMEQGELITGLTKKTWIERFAENGEFTLVAPIWTNIIEQLPIDALISHTDTKEIMIVENHEVSARRGEVPEVTVTGRSFETFFENRIVGANQTFPIIEGLDYILKQEYTWNQIVSLISNHILGPFLKNLDDELPYVSVETTVPLIDVGELFSRQLARGTLYEHIIELMKIDALGIKTVRPSTGSQDLAIVVHKGIDRTNEFVFSYSSGEELEAVDFLYTKKKLKNAAMVSGTWVEVMVEGDEIGLDKKTIFVNASIVDSDFETTPVGQDLTKVKNELRYIGIKALNEQNAISLKRAELIKNSIRFVYRKDYDLGDLINVAGGYLTSVNEPTVMRIIENVEIDDENGHTSYPTLSLDYFPVPTPEPEPEPE